MGDTQKYKPFLTLGVLEFIGGVSAREERTPRAANGGHVNVRRGAASAADSRMLTCAGGEAPARWRPRKPHMPKGGKATGAHPAPGNINDGCRAGLSCFLFAITEQHSLRPRPQGLITSQT